MGSTSHSSSSSSSSSGAACLVLALLCLAAGAALLLQAFGGVVAMQQQQHMDTSQHTQHLVQHHDADATTAPVAACTAALEAVAPLSPHVYVLEASLRVLLGRHGCLLPAGHANQPARDALSAILFVVMSSADSADRLAALQGSWLGWVPASNVVLVSDAHVPGFNTSLVPQLPADAYVERHHAGLFSGTHREQHAYAQANLRHLKVFQWLAGGGGGADAGAAAGTGVNGAADPRAAGASSQQHDATNMRQLPDGIDWVLMLDDDTFVNPPLLLDFIERIPPWLPTLMGFMWDGPAPVWDAAAGQLVDFPGYNMSWPCGGSGMLLSRPAFERYARVLFTPACPMDTMFSDAVLGRCAPNAGVLKVHSLQFKPEAETLTFTPSYRPGFMHDVGMAVTQHRGDRATMLAYACTVARRFGWPKADCPAHVAVECGPICAGQPLGR